MRFAHSHRPKVANDRGGIAAGWGCAGDESKEFETLPGALTDWRGDFNNARGLGNARQRARIKATDVLSIAESGELP